MKKLLITLFLAVSAMFASDVSASGPALIICGDYAVGWQDNCRNPYARRYSPNTNYNQGYNPGYNQGYNPGYNQGYNPGSYGMWQGQQVGIPQGIGIGQSFNTMVGGRPMQCSLADRAATGAVGALIGAAAGYAYDRHRGNTGRRYTEIGAVVGGVAGATLLCQPTMVDDEPPRVIYQQQGGGYQQHGGYRQQQPVYNQQPMQQPSYREVPQTREVASRCVVKGVVRRGLTEEECDELAITLSKIKTVSANSSTEKVSVNNTETKSGEKSENSNAAFWGWINPTSSTSNKKPCYASKQISGMPEKCSEVVVESPKDGETENVWRNRVAKLGFSGS